MLAVLSDLLSCKIWYHFIMKFSHLSRVYTTEPLIENQTIIVGDEDFHYLKSVMRLRESESFRLFNENDGEFLVKILTIGRSSLKVVVESLLRRVVEEKTLALAMCIIKPDRMLEAIKGAVQLGVTQIIPIISERTQYKKIAQDKVQRCIIQATEQCERFVPAELLPQMSLSDFCEMDDFEQVIFASESECESNKIININKIKEKAVILIGPEGGFSGHEVEMIKSYKHALPVSLGRSVLRAETAALAALACISMMRN